MQFYSYDLGRNLDDGDNVYAVGGDGDPAWGGGEHTKVGRVVPLAVKHLQHHTLRRSMPSEAVPLTMTQSSIPASVRLVSLVPGCVFTTAARQSQC